MIFARRISFIIAFLGILASPLFAGDTADRHCFGLLWCTECSSDTYAADYLFYFYSVEKSPQLNRFAVRPFFYQERNHENQTLRRSVLWPLSTYETGPDTSWFHFFPVYWRNVASRKKGISTTLAVPLFYRKINDAQGTRTTFVIPSYFSSGTRDTRQRLLFPIWSDERSPEETRRNALGFPTTLRLFNGPSLSLFETVRSTATHSSRFTPFFYHGVSEHGTTTNVLLLYHRVQETDSLREMLFPLYFRERTKEQSSMSLLGFSEVSIVYRHTASDARHVHVFPLFSRWSDGKGDREMGLLGHGRLSIFWRESNGDDRSMHFFPLFSSERAGDDRAFSFLGVSELAVVRSVHEGSVRRNRVTPFYAFRRDDAAGETNINILILYNSVESLSDSSHVIFPLWGRRRSQGEGTATTALGFPPGLSEPSVALYEHLSTGAMVTDRFFPFYYYRREADVGHLDVLLLYRHRRSAKRVSDVLLPLHAYRRNLETGDREFGLVGFPPFSLFDQSTRGTKRTSWLFPLISSDRDRQAASHSLSLVGWGRLALYHQSANPGGSGERLFPVFGHRRWAHGTAVSALGFAPPRNGGALALFEHRVETTRRTTRLVPLFWQDSDEAASTSHLNVLVLFDTARSSTTSRSLLFPLYSASTQPGHRSLSLLGIDDLSLIHFDKIPSGTRSWLLPLYVHTTSDDRSFTDVGVLYWDRRAPENSARGFFPLFSFVHGGDGRRVTAIGFDPIFKASLYQSEETNNGHSQLLFPIYSYRWQESDQSRDVRALLLYRHRASPSANSDRLFPLWSYTAQNEPRERSFGLIGVGDVSLYRHHTSTEATSDHLFPIYSYRHNRITRAKNFSIVWPLVSFESEAGRVKDASLLWWLVHYQHPDPGTKEFRILGGRAMAVYRRRRTPDGFFMEFNPIIPFYSFERTGKQGKDTEWNFLGGLLGRKAEEGKTKIKLFWIPIAVGKSANPSHQPAASTPHPPQ